MSVFVISGSVGSGKTTISKELSNKLNCDLICLNELAQKYKIEDIEELQTFDFDLDKLLKEVELKILEYKNNKKNLILEGHFAHFISPKIVDCLFVINRDLKELKLEYKKRGYNEQKIKDNLEVESFNLCFYEAEEEGYEVLNRDEEEIDEKKARVYCINNNLGLNEVVDKILNKIKNLEGRDK